LPVRWSVTFIALFRELHSVPHNNTGFTISSVDGEFYNKNGGQFFLLL